MPKGVYTRKSAPEDEPETVNATCDDGSESTVSAAVEAPAPYDVPADRVVFISREKEPYQFYIRGNKGFRCNDGRVGWDFDEAEAALVRRDDNVIRGRIVEQ